MQINYGMYRQWNHTALNGKEILIHAIRWILKKLTVTDEEIKVTDEFEEIMLSAISQLEVVLCSRGNFG